MTDIIPTKIEKPVFSFDYEVNEPALNPAQLLRTTNDLVSFTVSTRVPDTDSATAAKYGVFFVAPFPCALVSVSEVHATAGTDGGAVTLDVEKLTGTTAKGSGISMLSSTFNLKSTANTVVKKDLISGIAVISSVAGTLDRALATGERVALKTSGTLTAVNDVCVTLVFKTDLANLPI